MTEGNSLLKDLEHIYRTTKKKYHKIILNSQTFKRKLVYFTSSLDFYLVIYLNCWYWVPKIFHKTFSTHWLKAFLFMNEFRFNERDNVLGEGSLIGTVSAHCCQLGHLLSQRQQVGDVAKRSPLERCIDGCNNNYFALIGHLFWELHYVRVEMSFINGHHMVLPGLCNNAVQIVCFEHWHHLSKLFCGLTCRAWTSSALMSSHFLGCSLQQGSSSGTAETCVPSWGAPRTCPRT